MMLSSSLTTLLARRAYQSKNKKCLAFTPENFDKLMLVQFMNKLMKIKATSQKPPSSNYPTTNYPNQLLKICITPRHAEVSV